MVSEANKKKMVSDPSCQCRSDKLITNLNQLSFVCFSNAIYLRGHRVGRAGGRCVNIAEFQINCIHIRTNPFWYLRKYSMLIPDHRYSSPTTANCREQIWSTKEDINPLLSA